MKLSELVAHTLPQPVYGLTPILWRGKTIGGVIPKIAVLCESAPKVLSRRENGFEIIASIDALEHTLATWHAAGHLRQWRNERLDVLAPTTGEVLFPLERAARVPLGLTMAGAHLNVSTRREGVPHLWVAQRAASKKVNPLKWDNCVDGGIGAGESARVAIEREAWEEAGIDLKSTFGADFASTLLMFHIQDESPFLEYAYVFDLEVPADFSPENKDCEVGAFACLPVPHLIAQLEANAFTPDAATVTIDWLLRHDLIENTAARAQIARLQPPAR